LGLSILFLYSTPINRALYNVYSLTKHLYSTITACLVVIVYVLAYLIVYSTIVVLTIFYLRNARIYTTSQTAYLRTIVSTLCIDTLYLYIRTELYITIRTIYYLRVYSTATIYIRTSLKTVYAIITILT
jgi:hypothetical protein